MFGCKTFLNSTSPWADRIGMGASSLCVVHCLLTPLLLSSSIVFAHFLPSEERIHRSLALFVAGIGALALRKGFHTHRRSRVLLLMAVGLMFIFAGAGWGDSLPHHWMEVLITSVGSAFMISAHWMNHTFCREQCACVTQALGLPKPKETMAPKSRPQPESGPARTLPHGRMQRR